MARSAPQKFAAISCGVLVLIVLCFYFTLKNTDQPEQSPAHSQSNPIEHADSETTKGAQHEKLDGAPDVETTNPPVTTSKTLAETDSETSSSSKDFWEDLQIEEVPTLASAPFRALFTAEVGQLVELPLSPPLSAEVTMNHNHENGARVLGLKLTDFPETTASLKIDTNEVLTGMLLSRKSPEVLQFRERRSNSEIHLSTTSVDKVICSRFDGGNLLPGLPSAPAAAAAAEGAPKELAEAGGSIPLLESLPSAPKVIYLDFDGEYVDGTVWNTNHNNGDPINAAAYGSTGDVESIWKSVSADYRVFNVNVTTDRSVFDATNTADRCMVIFTPTQSWYSNTAGGVAYTNTFGDETDYMCWVFNSGINLASEAASHEVGHQLGLTHDGTSIKEYYSGHDHSGTGIKWGPIMGNAYYRDIVQFSKGEYADADNDEDDFAEIDTFLDIRTDEFGDTIATASGPGEDSPGAINMTGVIETQDDIDVFRIETGGTGDISLTLLTDAYTNLDTHLELLDSGGSVIAEANPADDFEATLGVTNQPAGVYYIRVEGVGLGTASDGYTDYGSVGEYVLSGGYVPDAGQVAPDTPAYITATDGESETDITVSWTPSAGATSYLLYRSTSDSSGTASLIAEVVGTTYADSTNLVLETSYYYFVKAKNFAGESAFSSSDSGFTYASFGAPTGVSATDGEPQITITWNPVSAAVDYGIYRSTSDNLSGAVNIAVTTDTEYVDTTAALDTYYYYWLDCSNAQGGLSDFSESDRGHRSNLSLDPPATISATDGDHSDKVTVTWAASTNAASYQIFRGSTTNSGDAFLLTETSNLTYEDTSIALDTIAYYFVRAKNGSTFSDFTSAEPGHRTYPVPSVPTNVTATDGTVSNRIDVSWSASADATGYYIYRATSDSSGSAIQIDSTSSTTYSDTTASAGTTYYYFVKAYNPSNESDFSASDSGIWNLPPPPVPTNVSATDGVFSDKVGIFWGESTNADGYRIYRSVSDSSDGASLLATSPLTSYADTTATPGVTYYYFVKAYRGATESDFSLSDAGFIRPPAPATPTSLSASDGSSTDHVTITWQQANYATGYRVFRSQTNDASGASEIADVTGLTHNDTTAVPNVTYYYFVEAYNGTGTSARSSGESGFRQLAPPATPANLSATDGAHPDKIEVSWSSSANATGYHLYRSLTTSINDASEVADTTSTSFTDTQVSAETSYYYFVRAYNGGGSSSFSGYEVGHRLANPPAVPTNLSASDGTSSAHIEVTWSPVSGADGYRLYRGTTNISGDATEIHDLSGTSFNDPNVAPDTNYYYFVSAYNSEGESDLSAPDVGQRLANPPAIPNNLSASDGTSSEHIAVSWSSVSGATGYRLYRGTTNVSGDAIEIQDLAGTSFNDADVAPDTNYYYFVSAYNDEAESDLSVPDVGQRLANPPAIPNNLSASDGTSSEHIAVSWSSVSGATGYRLYRGTTNVSGDAIEIQDLAGTSFNDADVAPDTNYYYFVSAYNGEAESDLSVPDVGQRLPNPPSVPTNLSASDGTSQDHIAVSWSSVSGATGYRLYRGTTNVSGDAIEIQDLAGTSFNDTDVAPDTNYYYFISAYNDEAESDLSAPDVGQRLPNPPAVPTNLSASDGTSMLHIEVLWTTATGATGYRLYRGTTNNPGGAALIKDLTGTSFNDPDVSADTDYFYFVSAYNDEAESDLSSPDSGSRLPNPPATPANLSASDGSSATHIEVTWTSVVGATGYRLYRGTTNVPGDAAEVADTNGTSYEDTEVSPNTDYYYFVSAYNDEAESDLSSPDVGHRLPNPPSIPTNLSASDGSSKTQVEVSWSSVSGADGYRLYRGSTNIPGEATLLQDLASTSFNDTGVDAETNYYYFVSSYNAEAESELSTPDVGHRLANPPAIPSSISASDGTSTLQIEVSWSTSTGATGYRLYRGNTNVPGDAEEIADVPGSSYNDSNVSPDIDYYYFVSAYNDEAESDLSSPDVGQRLPNPPAIPANLSASDGTSKVHIEISWGPVSGANGYRLYRGSSNVAGEASQIADIPGTSFNDSNVSADTDFYYFVSAYNDEAESELSSPEVGHRLPQPPPVPSSISASDGTSKTEITVSWPSSTGATGYRLYRGTSTVPGEAVQIADQSGTSFSDTDVSPNTDYYYFVSAYNNEAESDLSAPDVGQRLPNPPPVPTNLSASDGTSQDHIAVSWPSVSGATGYRLYRGTTNIPGDAALIKDLTGTSFNDTDVSADTDYFYFVSAYNDEAESPLSSPDSGSRLPNPPATPANLSASDGSSAIHIEVTWTSVAGATGYRLYRGTTNIPSGASEIADLQGLSFIDSEVDHSTSYYYFVSAYNTEAESNLSSPEVGHRLPNPPAAPASISASDGSAATHVSVTWPASANATGYKLFRGTTNVASNASQIADIAGTSFNDTDIDPDTTYYYFVAAYNTEGESARSIDDSGYRNSALPDTPTSISASDGTSTTQIQISWSTSTSAIGYRLYRSESSLFSGAVQLQDSAVTSYTDTSVDPHKTYYYFATAYNNDGESPPTAGDPGHIIPPTPSAPGSISASDGTHTTHVEVSWQSVDHADEYRLYRATTNNPSLASNIASVSGTTYDDSSAATDVEYFYFVSAYNEGGESSKSQGDSGFRAAEIPDTPATISASDGTSSESVSVSWSASSGAAGYRLVRSLTDSPLDGEEIADQTQTSFEDSSAAADTTYYYFALAYSSGGSSAFTAGERGYRNAEIPEKPTGLTASDGDSTDHVLLTWNASARAATYKVYRSSNEAGTDILLLDSTAATTFLDLTANHETEYYYFVAAHNSGGDSPLSDSDIGFRAPPVPLTPTNLSASDNTPSTHVAISWDASTWATGYRLYRSIFPNGSNKVEIADTADLSFEDTTAEYDQTYYYFVLAYNTTGESSLSVAESGLRQTPAPSAPTSVTATDEESGTILISWEPVEFAEGYYVYRNTSNTTDGATQIAYVTGETSYEDTSAVQGETYFYFVVASNSTGDSDYSTSDSGTRPNVPDPPTSPTGVAATEGTFEGAIEVSWATIAGAEEYLVYRNTIDDFDSATLVETTPLLSYYDTDVVEDTVYFYFVVARNATGDSLPSAGVSGYAGLPEVPDDRYEENDSKEEAYSLSAIEEIWLSRHAGLGIAADEDWYSLTLQPAKTRIEIIVMPLSPQVPIEIILFDEEENELATATPLATGSILSYDLAAAKENYYLRIRPTTSDTTSYDLIWKGLESGEIGNRPDMTIGPKPHRQIGQQHYNTKGRGQTIKDKVKGRKAGKVFFKTLNEGVAPVKLTSYGNQPDLYFDLKYIAPGTGNVTAQMATGRFNRRLLPLATDMIKLKVKVTRHGSTRRRKMIAYTTSTINNDPSTTDVARYKFKAIPKRKRR